MHSNNTQNTIPDTTGNMFIETIDEKGSVRTDTTLRSKDDFGYFDDLESHEFLVFDKLADDVSESDVFHECECGDDDLSVGSRDSTMTIYFYKEDNEDASIAQDQQAVSFSLCCGFMDEDVSSLSSSSEDMLDDECYESFYPHDQVDGDASDHQSVGSIGSASIGQFYDYAATMSTSSSMLSMLMSDDESCIEDDASDCHFASSQEDLLFALDKDFHNDELESLKFLVFDKLADNVSESDVFHDLSDFQECECGDDDLSVGSRDSTMTIYFYKEDNEDDSIAQDQQAVSFSLCCGFMDEDVSSLSSSFEDMPDDECYDSFYPHDDDVDCEASDYQSVGSVGSASIGQFYGFAATMSTSSSMLSMLMSDDESSIEDDASDCHVASSQEDLLFALDKDLHKSISRLSQENVLSALHRHSCPDLSFHKSMTRLIFSSQENLLSALHPDSCPDLSALSFDSPFDSEVESVYAPVPVSDTKKTRSINLKDILFLLMVPALIMMGRFSKNALDTTIVVNVDDATIIRLERIVSYRCYLDHDMVAAPVYLDNRGRVVCG
jgi:hypothetical protein